MNNDLNNQNNDLQTGHLMDDFMNSLDSNNTQQPLNQPQSNTMPSPSTSTSTTIQGNIEIPQVSPQPTNIQPQQNINTSIPQDSPMALRADVQNQQRTKMPRDYLEDYIGKNYEKINTSRFNSGAFFLGPIYYFYRKMYLNGIIAIILIFIASIPLSLISTIIPILAIVIILIPNIILGKITNNIYINFALKKINKIMSSEYDEEIIKEKCRKKGGTNILIIIIILVIELVIIGYIVKTATSSVVKTLNKSITESISDRATNIKRTMQLKITECPFYKECNLNNLYEEIISGYNFTNSSTYYIDPKLGDYFILDEKSFITKSISKTNTLDASIIEYDSITQDFNICLVINKNSNYYLKDYAKGGKKANSNINIDLNIPDGTMFSCSNGQKSWK